MTRAMQELLHSTFGTGTGETRYQQLRALVPNIENIPYEKNKRGGIVITDGTIQSLYDASLEEWDRGRRSLLQIQSNRSLIKLSEGGIRELQHTVTIYIDFKVGKSARIMQQSLI